MSEGLDQGRSSSLSLAELVRLCHHLQTDQGVAKIAYQVGFRDARYFSKCFQKEFGQTPSGYRGV